MPDIPELQPKNVAMEITSIGGSQSITLTHRPSGASVSCETSDAQYSEIKELERLLAVQVFNLATMRGSKLNP